MFLQNKTKRIETLNAPVVLLFLHPQHDSEWLRGRMGPSPSSANTSFLLGIKAQGGCLKQRYISFFLCLPAALVFQLKSTQILLAGYINVFECGLIHCYSHFCLNVVFPWCLCFECFLPYVFLFWSWLNYILSAFCVTVSTTSISSPPTVWIFWYIGTKYFQQ